MKVLSNSSYDYLMLSFLRTCMSFCIPPELVVIVYEYLCDEENDHGKKNPSFELIGNPDLQLNSEGLVSLQGWNHIRQQQFIISGMYHMICQHSTIGWYHLCISIPLCYQPQGCKSSGRETVSLSIRKNGVTQSFDIRRSQFVMGDIVTLSVNVTRVDLVLGDMIDIRLHNGD